MNKSMALRIVFGTVMIAGIAALLYGDYALEMRSEPPHLETGLPLAALALVALCAGFFELRRMLRGAGVRLLPVSGLAACLAIGLSPFTLRMAAMSFQGPAVADLYTLAVPAWLAVVFAEQMCRRTVQGAAGRIGATALAMAYLGGGCAAILAVRMYFGLPVLVLFLAAVKCTDIGAYFTGSLLGRHKLIPWLSPGKTWEGLAGGLAAAAGVSMLAHRAMNLTRISLAQAALFGVAVGLLGQFADLCESLLKRSCETKDSGALVPEFGGILDILDSPLLSAPFAYVLLLFLTGDAQFALQMN